MSGAFDRATGEPAEPLGWQPGLDWEVSAEQGGLRADLYSADRLLESVTARSRLGLQLRMIATGWKYRRAGW